MFKIGHASSSYSDKETKTLRDRIKVLSDCEYSKAYDQVILNKILKFKMDTEIKKISDDFFYLNEHEIGRCADLTDPHLLPYLFYRYAFKLGVSQKGSGNFPVHLLLEPVSYCNIKCVMCFQTDNTFSGDKTFLGKMDYSLFTKCIDEAREQNCRALTLASRGEPTLHPQISDFLEYCAPNDNHTFFDLKLNTNATKLTDDLCHSICKSGVTLLVFSVDSDNKEQYERIRVGGKFEIVFNNIKKFRRIKEKYYPNSTIKTRISGVLVEGQEMVKIHSFWSPYVDEVTLITEVPRWDSYNNKPNSKTSCCNILWERMYVWYDGICNPCDFDYKSYLAVGDANKNSLSSIWTSEKFNEIRLSHLEKKRGGILPCDRCPF